MHNESNLNEKKTLLSMNSDAYKYAMEDELEKLGLKARRAGTMAILVGGGFFVAYVVAKKLLSLRKAGKPYKTDGSVMVVNPKKESMIVTLIKEQIALFIFAIAKEKLEVFLKSLEKKISASTLNK